MRLARNSDSQKLLSWRNEPSARKYSRQNQEITREDHEVWFENRLSETQDESKIFIFSDSCDLIGMSRLDLLSAEKSEISLLVDPIFHSKGYGSKILELSIDFAFSKLNYSELIACIHTENLHSKALFSKFGFVKSDHEGSFETFTLSRNMK
jgi:UDP-2,4-diacetamido-2,4,6-trideoxy-beta-L-altropyranose hydrolase